MSEDRKPFLVDCFIHRRRGDDALFHAYTDEHGTPHLDAFLKGYAIVPVEKWRAAEAVAEAAERIVYYKPNPMRVLECIECGAVGEINERSRKRPADPHSKRCQIGNALAAWRAAKGER